MWEQGITRLAGVDEAGRGPLAGPVVAAAVAMDRIVLENAAGKELLGLTDSKQLSERRREHFAGAIARMGGVDVGIGAADVGEIDRLNILQATHLAMKRALLALARPPDCALVDGLPVDGLPCSSRAIVRGDSQSLLIAAASVVAKVHRDGLMREIDATYPGYGFAQHKGYGSSRHMQALLEHGPCPEHRRSFRPVREAETIRTRSSGMQGGGR
jgi:ribonuclease HII